MAGILLRSFQKRDLAMIIAIDNLFENNFVVSIDNNRYNNLTISS